MIKALRKLGIEGMYLNIVKAMYDKYIANIMPFFFFWWNWGLNSGPTPQATVFVMDFFEIGSCELFAWTGIEFPDLCFLSR
jgi:hypothetical protein